MPGRSGQKALHSQTLRRASEIVLTIEVGDAEIAVKLRSATTGSVQRDDVTPSLDKMTQKAKSSSLLRLLLTSHPTCTETKQNITTNKPV